MHSGLLFYYSGRMNKNTLSRAHMASGAFRLSAMDKLPELDLRQRFSHALKTGNKGVASRLETRRASESQYAPDNNLS